MDYEEADRNALKKAEAAMDHPRVVRGIVNRARTLQVTDAGTDKVRVTMPGTPDYALTVSASALVRAVKNGRVVTMHPESKKWVRRFVRETREVVGDRQSGYTTVSIRDLRVVLEWLTTFTESAAEEEPS